MKDMIVETSGGAIGQVILVYDELIASGTNEYKKVTMLAIKMVYGNVIHDYPRNIITAKSPLEEEMKFLQKMASSLK